MPEDRSTTVSRQQTLQQQRASHAWHQIAAVEKLGQQLRKD
jgi:hypothetical protein